MSSKSNVLVLTFLLASIAAADQIVLKNGDRVTGSVVKKDAKTLTVKTQHFGTVTVDWDQVATITADTPLTVVLPGGKTVQGTVTTNNGALEVKSGAATETAPLAEVTALRDAAEERTYQRLLKPGWLDLWTVNGAFNLAAANGNAKTFTLVVPVTAVRTTRGDKTTLYFNSIRSSALVNGVTSATARAVRGGWAYNRNLHPRVFLNVFNDNEYDRFQNLDLRVVVGGGAGFAAWTGERGRFELVGGFAWNREKYDPIPPLQPFVRNALQSYWGDNFNYKLNSRLSLTQSYRMFNTIKDSANTAAGGGYRQNADMSVTAQLTKWLTWNAAASDRYLNNPVPGRKKNDIVYSTGFGFVINR